jgi:hypothetical protein
VEITAGREALDRLLAAFRLEQRRRQLELLRQRVNAEAELSEPSGDRRALLENLHDLFDRMGAEEEQRFESGDGGERSDFFRDAAGSAYARIAGELARPSRAAPAAGRGVRFDVLMGLYDKSIVAVENQPLELALEIPPNSGKARPVPSRRTWSSPARWAPVTVGRGCPFRKSRSARKSSATGSART